MLGPASAFRARINPVLSAKREVSTPTQSSLMRDWKREVRRILRTAERAEQRGYVFDFDKMRLEPPRVLNSQSLGRIKKIRGDEVYRYAYKIDLDTGEFVKGTAGRKAERSQSAKKGAATRKAKAGGLKGFKPGGGVREVEPPRLDWDRVIIDNFLDDLAASNGDGARIVAEWVREWEKRFGKGATAEIVEEIVTNEEVTQSMKYDEGLASKLVTRGMLRMLDRGLITREQFDAALSVQESAEYYVDYDEGDELYELMAGR